MYLSKQLLGWFYKLTPQVNLSRQNRLISSVSIELIILGLVLLYITFSWELWLMLYLVAAASIIVAANLLILKKRRTACFVETY